MVRYIKYKLIAAINQILAKGSDDTESAEEQQTKILKDLDENIINLRDKYQNSSDFLVRRLRINDTNISFLCVEGMVNLQTMSEILLEPLLNQEFENKNCSNEIYDFIRTRSFLAADLKDVYTYEEVFQFIMSGFAVILIDGLNKGIVFGLQGFNFRSITTPDSEMNEKGSKEAFTEPLRINMTMVRRRIKSPDLKFEIITLGKESKTDICLTYMASKVSRELLRKIRKNLNDIKLDVILTTGYIQPFLEGHPLSLFSDVGTTERPDVLAAKITEGRIGVIVDGTPFALIVPFLFSENFQSLDDYSRKAYFATFIRLLKYLSFAASFLFPAIYIAVVTYSPELLPSSLLFNIAVAEEITPFPLFIESLIVYLLYEIMREAGLRLPRSIGHAVSIVGALVIGDAAVTAGLVGTPTVLLVAMTAITSFVVWPLYEPVVVLRFFFILLGGLMGLYGIAIGCMLILSNICTLNNFGSVYMAPISPFSLVGMRDTFLRLSFKQLQKRKIKIQNLNGMEITKKEE